MTTPALLPIPMNNWASIAYSPSLTTYLAVSNSGTTYRRSSTSIDGTSWNTITNKVSTFTSRTSAADNSWLSICWSPELTLFVAVSSSGTGNRVMTSPNGTTWTIRSSASDNSWYSVCWSAELTLFVTVSQNSATAATSPDGINWTQRTLPSNSGWYSVCWSAELGLFCTVANSAALAATSPDGINWTSRTLPSQVILVGDQYVGVLNWYCLYLLVLVLRQHPQTVLLGHPELYLALVGIVCVGHLNLHYLLLYHLIIVQMKSLVLQTVLTGH
jgi:hypothetical protein